MAIEAIAIVSLILLSVLVFALASFIAKHRSVAALKLLPGRKPSYLFGNALQLTGEAHGEYYQCIIVTGKKHTSPRLSCYFPV